MATELQDIGEYFNEEEIEQLEQATATLALTQEALETVRSARETLKGKGGGKKGGGKSGGRFGGKTGKMGTGKRPQNTDSASIRERKAKSRCKVCGQVGHWSGDPECSQGTRSAHLTEVIGGEEEEVLICNVISIPAAISVFTMDHTGKAKHTDSARGIVDTACGKTCAWFDDYLRELRLHGLTGYVKRLPCDENYRFGDGRIVPSTEQVIIPAVLGNRLITVSVCLVPGNLTLLLGRDFMDRFLPMMDMARRTLKIGNSTVPLVKSHAGHYAVELHPEKVHNSKREPHTSCGGVATDTTTALYTEEPTDHGARCTAGSVP